MHKDVKKALEVAEQTREDDEHAHRQFLENFLRALPNSTNTEHGVSLWYPTRILVELTEENPTE